jgi:hypothetical protein
VVLIIAPDRSVVEAACEESGQFAAGDIVLAHRHHIAFAGRDVGGLMHRTVCPASFSPDPSPGIRALAIRAAASRKIGVK